MTTAVPKPKPASLETELAVLNTKLDGIKSTLDVRLTNMDSRINDNATAIKAVERHTDAAILAQGAAMTAALDKKTDQRQSEERYGGINTRIEKMEGHMKWVVYLIVGAVITAVLAMVIIKPDRPTNPNAQLTVPAVKVMFLRDPTTDIIDHGHAFGMPNNRMVPPNSIFWADNEPTTASDWGVFKTAPAFVDYCALHGLPVDQYATP